MNIVLIEDGTTIRSLISRALIPYGYTIHELSSQKNIQKLLKTVPLSFIIINTNLILSNSVKLCSHLRKTAPNSIILAIQTRGTWQDRVEILKNGADDCLSFPFPTQELIARIHTLMRRPKRSLQPILTCGKISLNPDKHVATYNQIPIDLTRKEYHVLEYLVRNKDRTISRSELLDHVWDYKQIINSNTVDVHVRKIRQKMINTRSTHDQNVHYHKLSIVAPSATEIRTVHGIGYRMDDNIGKPERKKLEPPPEL